MNVNLAAARDPGRPLHVAVIGCGYWGRNYVRVFNALPGCRLTVVCDESLDRLQAIANFYCHTANKIHIEEVRFRRMRKPARCNRALPRRETSPSLLFLHEGWISSASPFVNAEN